MSLVEITKDCYLYHSRNIELVNLVVSIFFDDGKNKNFKEYYDLNYIEDIKKKYRFLYEMLNELPNKGMELLEFIFTNSCRNVDDNEKKDFPINDFVSIDEYEKYLLVMKPESFFYIFYGKYIDEDYIKKALRNSDKLSELYDKNSNMSKSFLGLKILFDNREMFIKDFFSCARSLQGIEFDNGVKYVEAILANEKDKFIKALEKDNPLEVSQSMMGKTFHNRGPYKKFIFMPSVFLSYRAIRFFYDYQILIYSLVKREMTRNDAVNVLKAISDESRFGIIEILCKNGSMIGKDLAQNLDIATSTLSHHIEQLKSSGFINEERVKNSKYYSVNSNSLDSLVKYLDKLLKN